MSLLDDPKVNIDQLKEWRKKEKAEIIFWKSLIKMNGVICIELDECFDLSAKLSQAWELYYEEKSPFVSKIVEYAHIEGRKVYGGSCKQLCKNDAIGFLERLSKQPLTPKPIVIISDITEIPYGNNKIYDDLETVKEYIINTWNNKNGKDLRYTDEFTIKPDDYLVFLTWTKKTSGKVDDLLQKNRNFKRIGNLKVYKQKFIKKLEKLPDDKFYILFEKLNDNQQRTIGDRLKLFNEALYNYLTRTIDFDTYKQSMRFNFNEMVNLKSVVSDIHNIVTLLTTCMFVKLFNGNMTSVDNNPNAKGYDLVYPNKTNPKIIAEIKCNNPCGNNNFGGQQKKAIKKDLENLKKNKKSSQISDDNKFKKALKFMVLLKYSDDVENYMKKNITDNGIMIIDKEDVNSIINCKKYKDGSTVNCSTVHVVCIPPDEKLISEFCINDTTYHDGNLLKLIPKKCKQLNH